MKLSAPTANKTRAPYFMDRHQEILKKNGQNTYIIHREIHKKLHLFLRICLTLINTHYEYCLNIFKIGLKTIYGTCYLHLDSILWNCTIVNVFLDLILTAQLKILFSTKSMLFVWNKVLCQILAIAAGM